MPLGSSAGRRGPLVRLVVELGQAGEPTALDDIDPQVAEAHACVVPQEGDFAAVGRPLGAGGRCPFQPRVLVEPLQRQLLLAGALLVLRRRREYNQTKNQPRRQELYASLFRRHGHRPDPSTATWASWPKPSSRAGFPRPSGQRCVASAARV